MLARGQGRTELKRERRDHIPICRSHSLIVNTDAGPDHRRFDGVDEAVIGQAVLWERDISEVVLLVSLPSAHVLVAIVIRGLGSLAPMTGVMISIRQPRHTLREEDPKYQCEEHDEKLKRRRAIVVHIVKSLDDHSCRDFSSAPVLSASTQRHSCGNEGMRVGHVWTPSPGRRPARRWRE